MEKITKEQSEKIQNAVDAVREGDVKETIRILKDVGAIGDYE